MSDKLDAILARANLPMTAEEVERSRRNWPLIESWLADLRIPEAATAELFAGRVVVVTETDISDHDVVDTIEEFWQSLGARVIRMSPDDHDAALAYTSHLPHLIASTLAAATPEDHLPLTATGWQDTTRIAAGDVELWRQIFLANAPSTLKALADFETVLARFRTALETSDGSLLAEILAEGKRRRDAVGS